MIETLPTRANLFTVAAQTRRSTLSWWLWYGFLMVVSLLTALAVLLHGPDPATIVWIVFFLGAAAIIYQPRYGVYLTLLLALPGDAILLYWYPFVKNLSSAESILYLHNAAIFSPAEIYIALTFLSWIGRGIMRREIYLYRGPLFIPVIIFTGFISFGLLNGVLTGGNLSIALWQVRPLFYLVAMLVLVSNLLTSRRHINILMWMAVVALIIEAFVGLYKVAFVLQFDLGEVARIAEHSSSIHANSILILLIAVWVYRGSYLKRLVLLPILPVLLISYLANQRRAAFLSLAIVLIVVAIVLYREQRLAFWLTVPLCVLIGTVYLGAFWNASGVLALPASAVKSVIAEDDTAAADRSSNEYRDIENFNLHFTIQRHPLFGTGFGKSFYVPLPMADISFFDWWNYFPHNSILWIWVNTGIGGFIAMLFLFGSTIITGARALRRLPRDEISAVVFAALLYIMTHIIFTYVDIAWDAQSMIYVSAMMGVLNSIEHTINRPQPLEPKRWPWQPDPVSPPGLRSV